MSLSHPALLVVASLLAAVGLWRLLRPPRLLVVVSHRQVWQQALAEVHRQRAWRWPQLWMVLLAAGGVALAAAVGGAVWRLARPMPPPVLVLLADTPQLAVRIGGHPEKTRQLVRLDELMAELDGRTAVRLVVVHDLAAGVVEVRDLSAGDWPKARAEVAGSLTMTGSLPSGVDVERYYRRPDDGMVYLLGEFTAVPPGRADVQWISRPTPPSDDLGIAAAGAVRTGTGGEVFVEVRRYAGAGGAVRVTASFAGQEVVWPPADRPPLDLAGEPAARAILPMPADFAGPITLRLSRPDDQPLNDVFYLAPAPQGGLATFELVGRPNEWIIRAGQSGRLQRRAVNGPSADWLIENEPADPVSASPGQGLVLIDPLIMPAGVRLLGELADVRIKSDLASGPWSDLSLKGLTIRRASLVAADPRWAVVAADAEGRPLIAWDRADRQLAIFFSVSGGNTDWFSQESWPLFWNALADLPGGGSGPVSGSREAGAGQLRWTWQPGPRPGLSPPPGPAVATNLPPDVFDPPSPGGPGDQAIRLPADQQRQTPVAAWAALAGGAVVLLSAGWVLNWGALRKRKRVAGPATDATPRVGLLS